MPRLLWLKSKHARSAFSEIARDNPSSSRIAIKGHIRVSGQIFQYSRSRVPDSARPGLQR